MADPQTTQFIAMAAGVGASATWVVSSLAFSAASRRLGPSIVNGLRIAIAVMVLWTIHMALTGSPVPPATREQVAYLALSGLIGLAIGDQLLLMSLVDLGPRIAVLVMSTAGPVFAALLGVFRLGERLDVMDLVGMAVTIGGVAWVITERSAGTPARPAPESVHRSHRVRGIACAVGAAVCQATGGMFSKLGIGHGVEGVETLMDPFGATAWRMGWALVFVMPIVVWRIRPGRVRTVDADAGARRVRYRTGAAWTGLGAVFGPCLGVWLSLIAYSGAPLGIAQTLCGLTPVMILPVVAWRGRERVTVRAVVGACVAIGGSAMLFLG
jgi:drug/metabolite transporter (DMT)-like permease